MEKWTYAVEGSTAITGAGDNTMTRTETAGVYTKTYTSVPAGEDYEVSVKGTSISSSTQSSAVTFDVTAACDVTVTYDTSTGEVKVTGDGVKQDVVTHRVIYFDNTQKGWSKVNIYYWSDENKSMTSWPGVAMTLVEGQTTIYYYILPIEATYVIFNDGSNQTGDLTVPDMTKNMYDGNSGTWTLYDGNVTVCTHSNHNTDGNCTECGAYVGHTYVGGTCTVCGAAEPVVEERVVYFRNTAGWSKPYVYTWTSGEGEYNGGWPGTAMTAVEGEENLYSCSVPTDAVNIIFNNGNGTQTDDLTLPTDGKNLYDYATGTWSLYTVAQPSISRYAQTLSYEDMIYIIGLFTLENVEGIDLSTNAGMLVWSADEYEALNGQIVFDEAYANVGLKYDSTYGKYYGTSDGIFTRDLHEELYFAGYVKLADGSYIYSEAKQYSPSTYAYNMINSTNAKQETQDLCVALLNYISAAQKYFYSDTAEDALVNKDLSDEQKAMDWSNVSLNPAPEVSADKQVEKDATVFAGVYKNLLFEEMISLGAVYSIEDSTVESAQKSGTIFWTAEQFAALEGTPSLDNYGKGTVAGMSQYRDTDGMWVSLAPKIAAKDMADTQYYYLGYVVHADGTVSYSGVVSYTIEQYINNMANNENVGEFVRSLYFYERAAEAALG